MKQSTTNYMKSSPGSVAWRFLESLGMRRVFSKYSNWSHTLNPITLRAAKRGLTIWKYLNYKHIFLKTFEGGKIITSQTRTLLQIFCEFLLYLKDIFKSMRVADDTFYRNSKFEWVNMTHSFLLKKEYPPQCMVC